LVNGLLLLFSFDESQSLFLMAVLSLLETTQTVRRIWLFPLTMVVLGSGVVSAFLLAPLAGVEPHPVEVALREGMCIGLVLAIDGFFRSVQTERDRVLESEERFRAIFTHAPVGMAIADARDGRLTSVNDAYNQMLGFEDDELLGRAISSLTVEEDFEVQRAAMQRVLDGSDDGYRMRKRYRRKDGAVVTGDVATSIVTDGGGARRYWIAQVNDVTAQLEEEDRRRAAERRYRALAENFPDGAVFVFDRDRRLVLMEGRELAAFGVRVADRTDATALTGELARWMGRWVEQAFTGEESRGEITTDGRSFQVRAVPLLDEDARPETVLVVATDVTSHKELEERILHSNTELQHALSEMQLRSMEARTLSEMGDLLAACADEEEAHEVLGRMVPRLFPRTSGAVYVLRASRNLMEMAASWGGMPPDEAAVDPEECWALRRGRPHRVDDVHREVTCRHVTPIPSMGYTCVPMLAQGETIGVLHVRCIGPADDDKATREQLVGPVAEQISLSLANFRLRESLRMQSIQDPLTGLYNRRFMQEFLERQLQRTRRHDQRLAVLMIDVDHLKATNDTLGHEAGDLLLEDVARVLSGGIRGGDVACRYGGDEFTIVASDAGPEEARALGERLRAAFRRGAAEQDLHGDYRAETDGEPHHRPGPAPLAPRGHPEQRGDKECQDQRYQAQYYDPDVEYCFHWLKSTP
jgi:diguanylate cyclase (GGDEF)-like protein/PAS domain S-box-containing protein